ncbi:MAG: endolytic transglycosylase MltG [Clostridia bacterium]|nr:endolytic transglycosylase MltG [Clostridia bacterium]
MLLLVLLLLLPALSGGCAVRRGTPRTQSETPPAATTEATVRVTFPEGSTVVQIAQKLEENGVCSAADFLAAARDPAALEAQGFAVDNAAERPFVCEGYVFPDTYDFYRGEDAARALRRFLSNAAAKYDAALQARCAQAGYTLDEILTIASIIQEEAGDPAEMPKVSAVLHNRLNSPRFSKLQCDVSSVYLREYVRPQVPENDYEAYVELYDTYQCAGLPAGPITNPGMEAVNAALSPADTNDYFFLTDADGVYHYAETWEEHQENCVRAGLS